MVERLLCTHDAENLKFILVTYIWNSIQGIILLKRPLVIGAAGVHPVPSRTRQLSLPAPMVLGWRRPGRVGHCQGTFLLPTISLDKFKITLDLVRAFRYYFSIRLEHLSEQQIVSVAV